MNIAELRSRYPGYSDDELVGALQATKYPEFSTQEIKDALGVKPPKRSLMAAANDTVIEAANAAAGMASSVGSFVSPGNRVSKFIDDKFIRAGEESQSDAVKAEKARMASELDQAGGAWDEVKAVGGYVARNQILAAAQAAGSFAIPGLGIKGAGMLAGGERVAQASAAGARRVANAGLGAGATIGAAGAGGDAASTAYDLAIKAGASPEQAEAAARQASVIPAVIGGAGGVIGAERLFAGAGGMKGGLMARALKTAGVEGVQEGIEEGVTQYEGQRAAMPFDPSIDPAKGVAGAATLGAVLGAGTGGGVALLTRERADHAAAALPTASSADEAINLALTATDVPLTVPPNFNADAAMGNLEAQRQKDEAGLRDFSGRSGVMAAGAGVPQGIPQAAAEPTAEVIDSPFGDRMLTLREQLGDERVRAAIRQNMGVDALGDALYYATQADKPNAALEAPIPDVTRDRLLGMAEAIVSRGTLRPINRHGVAGQETPAGLPAPAGQARIGLDTTPTGTMRVDAQGNAAPETRADVIAGRRQRQDGMTQQVDARPLPRDGVMVGEGMPSAPLTLKERAQAMRRRLEAPDGQPDLPATPGMAAPAGDAGLPDIDRGQRAVGSLVNDSGGPAPDPAQAPARSSGDAVPAGSGAGPDAALTPGGFDSAAWNKERDDRIKASRASGAVHLDKVPAYVETMRGKRISYVHDPKVTGTIRTVDNNGNVYVNWADTYSAEKEGASPMRDGKKTVMQTSLGPRDLKDYALADTLTPNAAAPAVQPAPDGETAVPPTAAAPAPSQEADRTTTPVYLELRKRLDVLRDLQECLA